MKSTRVKVRNESIYENYIQNVSKIVDKAHGLSKSTNKTTFLSTKLEKNWNSTHKIYKYQIFR